MRAITLGESAVGKSALIRAIQREPWEEHFTTTIGVDSVTLCFTCLEQDCRNGQCLKCIPNNSKIGSRTPKTQITFMDTAGQERFRSIVETYYRSADLVLLCFKLGDQTSLAQLESWYEQAKARSTRPRVAFAIVGLQADLLRDSSASNKNPLSEGPLATLPYFQVSARLPKTLVPLIKYICRICRQEELRNTQSRPKPRERKVE